MPWGKWQLLHPPESNLFWGYLKKKELSRYHSCPIQTCARERRSNGERDFISFWPTLSSRNAFIALFSICACEFAKNTYSTWAYLQATNRPACCTWTASVWAEITRIRTRMPMHHRPRRFHLLAMADITDRPPGTTWDIQRIPVTPVPPPTAIHLTRNRTISPVINRVTRRIQRKTGCRCPDSPRIRAIRKTTDIPTWTTRSSIRATRITPIRIIRIRISAATPTARTIVQEAARRPGRSLPRFSSRFPRYSRLPRGSSRDSTRWWSILRRFIYVTIISFVPCSATDSRS